MTQVLKESVRERILAAALEAFAGPGYAATTMAEIARAARLSTGNLYHYFEGKEALFLAAVPPAFVDELDRRFDARIAASTSVTDVRGLPPGHPYLATSEALLEFSIANRLRVVALIGHAQGTRYDGFTELLLRRLVDAALQHYAPGTDLPETLRFGVREIYENYLASLARILAHFQAPADIRAAVEAYQRYHLVGLRALFGT